MAATDLTPGEQAAVDAVGRVAEAKRAVDTAIAERDAAIVLLFRDGRKPPEIARLTGMSVSNVRLITDRLRWADKR